MAPEQLRASDADRERLAGVLGEQLAAGRLTLPEFDDRVAAAYAATTLGELDGLLRDLPAVRDPGPAAAAPPARAPLGKPGRPGRGEWATWSRVGALCVAIWLVTSVASGGPLYFWPAWVFGPWGLVLLAGVLSGRRPAPRVRRTG